MLIQPYSNKQAAVFKTMVAFIMKMQCKNKNDEIAVLIKYTLLNLIKGAGFYRVTVV